MTESKSLEQIANFVLSTVKNGLTDLVENIGLNESKDSLEFKIQKDLISKFENKFPESSIDDLNKVVEWIILKAYAQGSDNVTDSTKSE